MIKVTKLAILMIVLILLSGCGPGFNAAAASSTPTIVALAATTVPAATPAALATATPIPPPSPTATPTLPGPTPAAPATPTAAPPTPAPAAATAAPAPVSEPPAGPWVTEPAAPERAVVSNADLSGEWDFTFGVMSLTQRGSSLEGTYQWYGGVDTGRITGIVIDELDQFKGLWISDRSPNSQGLLNWRLNPDRAGFSGSFEGGRGGQWCGVRSGQPLPAGCGLSGVWEVRFGSPPDVTGQASLVQTGRTVSGSYVDSAGGAGEITAGQISVESLTEARVTGTWRNDRGESDSFDWRLDLTTGRTFQGRRDPGNSEWCGWRQGTDPPQPCGW